MSDMAAVCLKLRPRRARRVPLWLGRASHAFFLQTAQQIDPALSRRLHDGPEMKPFTCSTLIGAPQRGGMLNLTPAQSLTLRYTTLQPDLTAHLLHDFIPIWQRDGVDLHGQLFEVEAVQLNEETHWAAQTSYRALYDDASNSQRILTLNCSSPLAFKQKDGFVLPVPLPELVFQSLLERWLLFSELPLPDDLATTISTQLQIEHYKGETKRVRVTSSDTGAGTAGYTGRITYRLRGVSETHCKALNALADYARYSGVGIKTTMGMGQVCRITT